MVICLYFGVSSIRFDACTHATNGKSRRSQDDAEHVIFVLTRFWAQVDINRIQEDDMDRFVTQLPAAAPAWKAIKRRYGQ